jgi:Cyclin D1 binding domain
MDRSLAALYFCLAPFIHPLPGLYQLVPTSMRQPRGGLYIVKEIRGVLCLASISAKGRCGQYHDDDTLAFQVQEFGYEGAKAYRLCVQQTVPLEVRATEDGISIIGDDSQQLMVLRRLDSRLLNTEWVSAASGSASASASDSISTLSTGVPDMAGMPSGLFTASYGSHGLEILHLYYSQHCAPGAQMPLSDLGEESLPSNFLLGLKVSGDPNVPANQLSFCINFRQPYDIQAHSDRPVIIFPPDIEPVILDIRTRQPSLRYVFRGKGQINRDPPIWAPEWVNCSLLVYAQPPPGSDALFSILWDDELHLFQHMIDFSPLHRTSCGVDLQSEIPWFVPSRDDIEDGPYLDAAEHPHLSDSD